MILACARGFSPVKKTSTVATLSTTNLKMKLTFKLLPREDTSLKSKDLSVNVFVRKLSPFVLRTTRKQIV